MLARAALPLGCIFSMAATGGIYAAPTNQPVIFIIIYGRGRGLPRPCRAINFYCPVGRGDLTPPYGEFCNRRKTARRGQDPSLHYEFVNFAPPQKPSPWGEGGALVRRMRGKCPVGSPSSVTCGDSFPLRGEAKAAVCPLPRQGIRVIRVFTVHHFRIRGIGFLQ